MTVLARKGIAGRLLGWARGLRLRVGTPTRHRLLAGVQIGIGTALVVLLAAGADLFPYLRLSLDNVFFVPRDTSGAVVIVAADEASHAAYGRSPVMWPRTVHASLVDALAAAGARVIAFDVLFSESAEGDDVLAAAIERARTQSASRTRVVMPIVPAQRSEVSPPYALSYSHALVPTERLPRDLIVLGHTLSSPDVDGAIRWQPTRIQTPGGSYYSLAIATYLSYLRVPAGAFDQVVRVEGNALQVAERRVPIDRSGQMLINYFSAPGDERFTVVSFRDVVEGAADPAIFADKIVLVGVMNHAGTTDMYGVPISFNQRLMAGVEIHANTLETLLQDRALSWLGGTRFILLLIGLALLASIAFSFAAQRWYLFTLTLIALVLVWVSGVLVWFTLQRQIVDLFYTLAALLLPAPFTLVYNTIAETRRRQRAEILLQSALRASSQRLSLEATLSIIAADLRRILHCGEVQIWLRDPRSGELSRAFPAPAEGDQPPDGACRSVVETAFGTPDVQQHDRCVAVPLNWQSASLGVIVAPISGRLSRARRELLALFGWQTASIIANVLAYRETLRLSDLKTRMLRLASHDLKNPLSVVLLYTEMLQEQIEARPDHTERDLRGVKVIHKAGRTMLTIVEEILDLERVRSRELILQPIALSPLLRELGELHRVTIEQKQQVFTLDLPEDFPEVLADEGQLRHAVGNLLSNASKYTPAGGQITLRLTRQDGAARIAVVDTGYGIPKPAQGRLFEEFYRVRTDQTAEIEGTGLGLSLVKAIAEGHRGKVGFVSEPGQGSTFYIDLPLPAAAAPLGGVHAA